MQLLHTASPGPTSEMPFGSVPETRETGVGGVPPKGRIGAITKLPNVQSPNPPKPLDSGVEGLVTNSVNCLETDTGPAPVAVTVKLPVWRNGVPDSTPAEFNVRPANEVGVNEQGAGQPGAVIVWL